MVPEHWDRRSKLAALSHRARTPRQSSTWEREKLGQRRRIHTQKTKTLTIIDTQIRITTSTSPRVEVKPTFGGLADRRCMRRSSSAHATQLICCCYLCRLKPVSWVEGQCCYWQWVAEQRSKERLHERRRLKKKRALKGARRPLARTASCVRTARIARKDVNFEVPFGDLGSFSCKRNFYPRKAYFELQSHTTAAETYGPHMGCIWATYGDLVCNIWSFFNIWGRKSFRKHNIWATYGSLFQTYGVLLKHIGPFWNIWDLSETYGAFLKHMGPFVKGLCFFFRPATLHYSGIWVFFSLKSFANHKSGLFPIFLPKKNVYWKF